MENVVEMASKLGKLIRENERYRILRQTEEKVLSDSGARQIQDALEKHLQRIHTLESEMKPIEVADKRELSRLQEEARKNPGLQELLKAQADYFEMMNQVNNAILAALAPDPGDTGKS